MSFGWLPEFLIYFLLETQYTLGCCFDLRHFFFGLSFNMYSFFNLLQFGNWQSAGVEFPPREENSVPLFTPPQTQPIVHHASAFDDAAIHASLQSDASGLRYYLSNIPRPISSASFYLSLRNILDT